MANKQASATKKKKPAYVLYEETVQSVYQTLLSQGVLGMHIPVERNVNKAGISGCDHQIDIYYEFILANVKYTTAIECKHLSRSIGIGRIRDFFGVLRDTNMVTGIIVTTKGIQSGAKRFADFYGINYEIID